MTLSDIRKVLVANGEKSNVSVDRVDITLKNGKPSVMHVMFTDGRLGEFDATLPEEPQSEEE